MTVYIEKKSSGYRELGNGAVVNEELLSMPEIVIRRTNANGIVLDGDIVRHLKEKNLEDIENARHLSYEPNPEEPLKIRTLKGVWGGVVRAD